ncbi:MAG: hypothetical protein EOO38_15255, partial [Cytophagaceae bacterium]
MAAVFCSGVICVLFLTKSLIASSDIFPPSTAFFFQLESLAEEAIPPTSAVIPANDVLCREEIAVDDSDTSEPEEADTDPEEADTDPEEAETEPEEAETEPEEAETVPEEAET